MQLELSYEILPLLKLDLWYFWDWFF